MQNEEFVWKRKDRAMKYKKSMFCFSMIAALAFTGCGVTETMEVGLEETSEENETENTTNESTEGFEETVLAKIDAAKWNYREEDDVYWQVGISYCENPSDASYETLGIFVPGAYMNATENEDGTYTCEVNANAVVEGYTAETAPIVFPVDTPGYSAMAAPTGYVSIASKYTNAGFIYVSAGCRGRNEGAPAGVTDLKAAIRYVRYNEENIPGCMERIFSFGMSGGGAQSALIGSTGDSQLYTPYLEEIGAVSGVSDAVAGSMCWCPITSLDYASEAYEWNMGVTRTDLSEEMKQLSDDMAEAFAIYVNELGLTDEEGNVLTLSESEEGIYQAGTYYEYVKEVIENSLNNFLQDTSFPYDASESQSGFGERGGMGAGRFGNGEEPEKQKLPETEELPEDMEKSKNGELPAGETFENDEQTMENLYNDNIKRNKTSSGLNISGKYDTAQDYIDALNAESEWITYDSETNTVAISSITDFVKAFKNASKNVGAFDDLDATQGENVLFGYGDGSGAHFDSVMAELLSENESYGEAYASDLEKKDSLGNTVATRVNMYNPMYYLSDYYDGYQSSNVAQYWRIRTGINQGDTSLTTEINLALALENYGAEVDFATVWGQGHVQAERTGDAVSNFIAWVNECLN